MTTKLITAIKNTGLSQKAAEVYLAALELGEATIQELARQAHLKRTTLYYTIEELLKAGALLEAHRSKKVFYIPESPANVLRRARERMVSFERTVPLLEEKMHRPSRRTRAYFLYGISGFKNIWDKILEAPEKEFCIITGAENFLDFVREKYILREIIQKKRKLGVFSKQLISDSEYARKVVVKDLQENRASRLLPPIYKLPYTEVICADFVAFISPRSENFLFIVENRAFAKTRRSFFDMVWNMAGKI